MIENRLFEKAFCFLIGLGILITRIKLENLCNCSESELYHGVMLFTFGTVRHSTVLVECCKTNLSKALRIVSVTVPYIIME